MESLKLIFIYVVEIVFETLAIGKVYIRIVIKQLCRSLDDVISFIPKMTVVVKLKLDHLRPTFDIM